MTVLGSEGLDHAEGAPTRFMVASGGVLSEAYGQSGHGVCLGDGQKDEGVPSRGTHSAYATRCAGVCPHT